VLVVASQSSQIPGFTSPLLVAQLLTVSFAHKTRPQRGEVDGAWARGWFLPSSGTLSAVRGTGRRGGLQEIIEWVMADATLTISLRSRQVAARQAGLPTAQNFSDPA